MVLLVLSVGLFMFRSVFLDTDFSLLNSPIPSPTLDAQTLKLLPEKHVRSLFTYSGIWLFPKNQCQCDAFGHQGSYNLEDAYDPRDLPAVNLRRQAELEHFQRREGLPRPPPLLAQPNLPFGYPVHGVEVMPLHTIPIPGLRFEGPDAPIYEVTLTASLGTLNTLADVPDNVVKGRGQKQLNILTSSRELLNFILQHVTYTSTEYHLHRVDVGESVLGWQNAEGPHKHHHCPRPRLSRSSFSRKPASLAPVSNARHLTSHLTVPGTIPVLPLSPWRDLKERQ